MTPASTFNTLSLDELDEESIDTLISLLLALKKRLKSDTSYIDEEEFDGLWLNKESNDRRLALTHLLLINVLYIGI